MIRTSQTHPLRIAKLPVGAKDGAIGVTFAPGKHQSEAMTGSWRRDLDIDLATIRGWGATHLISLIEPWEFGALSIEALPERAVIHGLQWHGLPITDGAAPDHRLLGPWGRLGPELVNDLLSGGRVVAHCKGGLGRAGTVACMLLLDCGIAANAEEAMYWVRTVRPGAIETPTQEAFLREWSRKQAPSRPLGTGQ